MACGDENITCNKSQKVLLTVAETRAYLGLGDTMARKLMRTQDFGLRIGNRLYSNRILLDKWLTAQSQKQK